VAEKLQKDAEVGVEKLQKDAEVVEKLRNVKVEDVETKGVAT